ncbi:1-phosphatidylinositol 4,5-bisphosphate phosphodiesterase zeta-1 isoform X1 [Hydra vulgaris]|uniref:1-phosphatidylinositol 4,5-bisphosphate phosphodiesterase zeta-1 isoform X1 n=1 Tax=Hydra vulgaris TaxID=6087 RepID=UPI001F5E4BC0|nr:1-phosphatidylinositol 4,5-bisphosphate phosphodiesterase zeta-1-like isoform X1 [Hydra vulgaris]XP_047123681.1 1-phosphatidylinositol 4,5-bisphosphate phosphodiesterase zeta-1-like isoform X1 [Hydra vulgaris]
MTQEYELTGSFEVVEYSENIDEILKLLCNGCEVRQSNLSKKSTNIVCLMKKKYLFLDEDKTVLRYKPSVLRSNFKILVSNINDINVAESIETKLCFKKKLLHQFIISYKDEENNAHQIGFIVEDQNQLKLWTSGLQYLSDKFKKPEDPIVDDWLREAYFAADINKNNLLGLKEINQMFNSLNIFKENSDIKLKFQECCSDGKNNENAQLTRTEFAKFFKFFSFDSNEVSSIIKDYGRTIYGKICLNAESLQKFLSEVQQQKLSLSECKKLITKYDENKGSFLSAEGVIRMLISEDNDILDPIHKNIHQDMSRPLTDYFINSSHNTYLLSDQLVGMSSTKAYDKALKKGCKTLELDCYDGENNEPIVYHGFTLTSKVLFKDIIDTIAFGAFLQSDYPVILSFENHCSPEQQIVMAQHLKEKLGNMLFVEDPDVNQSKLPSPEALKRKIFIKAKKRSQNAEIDDDAVDASIKKRQSKIKQKINVAEEFSNIINYVESITFKSLEQGLASQKYFQNVSLGEKKLLQLGKDYPMKLIEYSNKFLVRTYPRGSRIDSSNYNPTKGWVFGCQIVALNFQTPGELMDINDGLFALNGKCGYVLKPECLRSGKFDPQNVENFSKTVCKVNIKIISGHLLPKASKDGTIPDPFIRVNIHGIPKDEVLGKFATKKIKRNGFNPQWNEDFQFDLYAPELAHIRFAISDSDMGADDYICQYSIPFSAIRTGYRRVPLLNRSGHTIRNASLLVFIQKNIK